MISVSKLSEILSQVADPEIPVITIEDLGIIRNIEIENGKPIITITPTYSGCPAMTMIEVEMRTALLSRRNKRI
jgi:ring-1,2-phenylacetyl-CoA epoxidase subunit PaaD